MSAREGSLDAEARGGTFTNMTTPPVKVRSGTIEMTWNAHSRLATIRFDSETIATGADAVVLVTALGGWIGSGCEPFGLLGDGGKLGRLDAEYRSVWGDFCRQHREDIVIAFFNMSAVVRIAAEMFRIGTRLNLKAFAEEQEARSWLRGRGIAA